MASAMVEKRQSQTLVLRGGTESLRATRVTQAGVAEELTVAIPVEALAVVRVAAKVAVRDLAVRAQALAVVKAPVVAKVAVRAQALAVVTVKVAAMAQEASMAAPKAAETAPVATGTETGNSPTVTPKNGTQQHGVLLGHLFIF